MNPTGAHALLLCALTSSFAPGCALLSKGDPGAARFFSLDRAPVRPGTIPVEAPGAQGDLVKLRLGRVMGASHLEERLVFRNSAFEVNYYRELRWTEPPELCLKRLLTRVLFEERKLQQVMGGVGPTLEVQLTTLDEIRSPQPLARAQLVAKLYDGQLVFWEETLTVECPIVEKDGGDPALATVEALGAAMQTAVDRMADRVVRRLEEHRRVSGPRA